MRFRSADEFQPENQPIYWFTILESSRDRGDLENAARAQRELKRLGVNVTYPRLGRREATPCG